MFLSALKQPYLVDFPRERQSSRLRTYRSCPDMGISNSRISRRGAALGEVELQGKSAPGGAIQTSEKEGHMVPRIVLLPWNIPLQTPPPLGAVPTLYPDAPVRESTEGGRVMCFSLLSKRGRESCAQARRFRR